MVHPPTPAAFTFDYGSMVLVLRSHCHVREVLKLAHRFGLNPRAKNCNAIWDTGATCSVISNLVVQELNLKPIGKTQMFHADGQTTVNVYYIDILLPNKVAFSALRVTEGKLNNTDVLIGMDIISQGDFAITSAQGKTTFSFQLPSTHHTDYVAEFNHNHINNP